MEETDETIMAIAGVAIFFFLLLFLGFVILNRKISQKIWKPLYSTLDNLKSFDLESEKKMSFEVSDIHEFNELNVGLEKLIEKNISVYIQQKEFTENASHELQTPLAIIKSQLDILLQSDELTTKLYETVENINITLTRAHRINKNLLLLSKIENQQLFPDKEKVDFSELVNESLGILLEHIDSKEIVIEKNISSGIFIQGNRTLLEIMVNNLLLNGIRHNKVGGSLAITLSEGLLYISNSGNGTLNSATLFKRFISASKETPGSGLGLAIIHQIVQRFGWKIDYLFTDSAHIFSVRF